MAAQDRPHQEEVGASQVTNANKAKGSTFEREVVAVFNANGFPHVERRYGAGNTVDKGDLNGIQAVIECKNVKSISLASIVDETNRERANSRFKLGVAVIKRRGKGAEHSYAVMNLTDMCALLKDAGY